MTTRRAIALLLPLQLACGREASERLPEAAPEPAAEPAPEVVPELPRWEWAGADGPTCAEHTATLSAVGTVIVIGECTLAGRPVTALRFEPEGELWTALPGPPLVRHWATASLLSTGEILYAGGLDAEGNVLRTADRFDPARGRW